MLTLSSGMQLKDITAPFLPGRESLASAGR